MYASRLDGIYVQLHIAYGGVLSAQCTSLRSAVHVVHTVLAASRVDTVLSANGHT